MTALTWDRVGERKYETGVDHGVLYIPDEEGAYDDGVAWNGLTAVTEKPSGAEANAVYADNMKYLNLISLEEFMATVEAITYPVEFEQFDGLVAPSPGVTIGQQPRRTFGLCYRTLVGTDVAGTEAGYKLHLVYGLTASPTEKAYSTVNDSPEAMPFSWDVSSVAVPVTGYKATSILVIDSTEVDPDALVALETVLYGSVGINPALPSPDYVLALFSDEIIAVDTVEPAFNSGTNTITIPVSASQTYYIDGVAQAAGAVVITEDTVVESRPNLGYVFNAGQDDDWFYNYTP